MANVVLVGGGKWQMDLLRYLKSKEYMVHVINPTKTQVTQEAAGHIRLDVRWVNSAIVDRISRLQPVFIAHDQSDVCVVPAARLSQALGTPGIPVNTAKLFSDKIMMYQHAFENKIPVAPFARATTLQQVKDFAKANDYPVILKPADSTASRGFGLVTNEEDISKALKTAMSYSKMCSAVVQRLVTGTEVTADGVCTNNKHRTLLFGTKQHFRPSIVSYTSYPSELPAEQLRAVAADNDKFVHTANLPFGITHAEWMIDDEGKHYLMEIAARGGGCGISSIVVPHVREVALYDIMEACWSGKTPPNVDSLAPASNAAVLQFFEFDKPIEGIDALREHSCIKLLLHDFRIDDYVPTSAKQSLCIVAGRTSEEVQETLTKVRNHFEKQGARWK